MKKINVKECQEALDNVCADLNVLTIEKETHSHTSNKDVNKLQNLITIPSKIEALIEKWDKLDIYAGRSKVEMEVIYDVLSTITDEIKDDFKSLLEVKE